MTADYDSPLGGILLAADDMGLTGLWFRGAKYFARGLTEEAAGNAQAIETAKRWLDIYFSGRKPDFTPPLHLTGTPFQRAVWEVLGEIPYGQTTTYGSIAKRLGQRSAQAVGGAVGKNPISILIPCHRVVGMSGGLTGYAGGLDKKAALLCLEGVEVSAL